MGWVRVWGSLNSSNVGQKQIDNLLECFSWLDGYGSRISIATTFIEEFSIPFETQKLTIVQV